MGVLYPEHRAACLAQGSRQAIDGRDDVLGHGAAGMADGRVHEAQLHINHHKGGAGRVQIIEGVRRAAARFDAGDNVGRDGKLVHGFSGRSLRLGPTQQAPCPG